MRGLFGTSDDRGVNETLELKLGNLGPDEALNVADIGRVFRRDQSDRVAHRLRPAGAADTMDVIFGLLRHIVIDDVRDPGDVDAAGGNIRGDHHFILAGLEAFEGFDALVLRPICVQHRDRVIAGLETTGDLVGTVFRAGKHDHAIEFGFGEQCLEQIKFLIMRDRVERVIDRFIDRTGHADLDFGGIAKRKRRDGRDLRRHRGGEKQRLPLPRTPGDNVFDGRQETHVQHAIDLVENENVDVAETDLSGLEIVHKPARRRDDDIDAALQFGTLGPVTNATKHRDRADIGKAGKITERRLDLCREFTGRFEDEDAGPAVGAEAREHREGKGRRFAGTGLSRSDQVAAAEDDGDGAKLDRSRVGITGGLDAAQDRLGEIKSLKSHESE